MTIAERFKAAREKSGRSQKAVAELLGMKQARIGAIENGTRVPTLDWLRDAADTLGWARESLSPDLAPRPKRKT